VDHLRHLAAGGAQWARAQLKGLGLEE
jgi:hypothetical protein